MFGVEADVIRVAEHLLKRQPRLVQPAGASERLRVSEGADRKGALLAAEPIGGDLWGSGGSGIRDEVRPYGVEGGQPLRGYEGDELD